MKEKTTLFTEEEYELDNYLNEENDYDRSTASSISTIWYS